MKAPSGRPPSRPSGSSTSRASPSTASIRQAAKGVPGPRPRASVSSLPTRDGWLIAGLKTGLHRFNPETGNFALLHVVEPHAPNNRLNDGFVDSEGFLWFGSMDDNEEEPSGALYQLDREGCVTPRSRLRRHEWSRGKSRRDACCITRTRSPAIIYAFDRARAGTLTNKRVFVRLPRATVTPTAHRRCRRLHLDRPVRRLGPAVAIRRRANC